MQTTMRKILGTLLLGLGGFLLVTALLALAWAPGQVKKTPLDTDSMTRLAGQASYLGGERGPVTATSHNVIDGPASTGDVAVFSTFSCLVWDRGGTPPDCVSAEGEDTGLITASTDNFATDRRTGLSVGDQEKYVGANASPHEGLVNKFPFDTEQKTYPFWDGILDRAVDAAYQGEEVIDGLKTYKFLIDVKDQPAEISKGIQGTYSLNKTFWVDPVTGAIIKQSEKQARALPGGESALDLDFSFTDETVAKNVKTAKDNGSRLGLLRTLPWIAGLLGLLALGAGLLLNRDSDVAEADVEAEPVGVHESHGSTAMNPATAPTYATGEQGHTGATAANLWGNGAGDETRPMRTTEGDPGRGENNV